MYHTNFNKTATPFYPPQRFVANFLFSQENSSHNDRVKRFENNSILRLDVVLCNKTDTMGLRASFQPRKDNDELYFLQTRIGSKCNSTIAFKIFISREQTLKKKGRGGGAGSGGCVWALNSNGSRRLAGSESSWNVDLKRKGNGTPAAPI